MLAVRTRTPRHLSPDEITSFIEGHVWRFAKTMAHIPHAYVARKTCRSEKEFERFVITIRRQGYKRKFGRYSYTYLDWPVEGVIHQFWTMGSPLARTIIINRAVKPSALDQEGLVGRG